jgi:hypothetical protein
MGSLRSLKQKEPVLVVPVIEGPSPGLLEEEKQNTLRHLNYTLGEQKQKLRKHRFNWWYCYSLCLVSMLGIWLFLITALHDYTRSDSFWMIVNSVNLFLWSHSLKQATAKIEYRERRMKEIEEEISTLEQ